MTAAFKPLRQLPQRIRRTPAPGAFSPPRELKYSAPKSQNYNQIRQAVMAAILSLPLHDQHKIPAAGTLPEQMVALALVWLKYDFVCQRSEDGGRLRLGGAVVDVIVYMGGSITAIRVQGDYWHSQAERKNKDAVQLERLRAKGYRVADLWEQDIYRAWVDGRLKQFVEEGVNNAA